MEYCNCKTALVTYLPFYHPDAEDIKKCSRCGLLLTSKVQLKWRSPAPESQPSWRRPVVANLFINETLIYQLESPANIVQMWLLSTRIPDLEMIYLEQRNGFLPMSFPVEFENNIEQGRDGVGYSFADENNEAIRRAEIILKEYFKLLNSKRVSQFSNDSIRSVFQFDPYFEIELFFDRDMSTTVP